MTLYRIEGEIPIVHESVFIAPTASIIGKTQIGKGSSVWFQTVIRGDAERIDIGENTNIQDLSMCHADPGMPVQIGNYVTIGHRCVIHGCRIEDNCLIGMGAIVMNGAVIGEGSMIAAGSVILERTVIPPYSMVAGIPGQVKRTHGEDMVTMIKLTAQVYMDRSKNYLATGVFECMDKQP